MTTWLWLLWEHLFGTPRSRLKPKPFEPIELRLQRGAEVLDDIKRRRSERHDKHIGVGMEISIIRRELEELEAEWKANPTVPIPQGRIWK